MKKTKLLLKIGIIVSFIVLFCALFAITAGAESDPVFASFDDVAAATEFLRQQMVERQEAVTITLPWPEGAEFDPETFSSIANDQYDQVWGSVFDHTGNGYEGDYLKNHYKSHECDIYYISDGEGDRIELCFRDIIYYTGSEEENYLTDTLSVIYDSLDLDGKSDYEKFDAIYDWIVKHVVYDYNTLYDDGYYRKYSAFAAAINRTSVCQGYANLLYRMLLDNDVDCRIITGVANNGNGYEPHAWNIVGLKDKNDQLFYYYVDATWDSGAVYKYPSTGTEFPMSYRLRGVDSDSPFILDHTPAEEFSSWDFLDAYFLSGEDYAVPFFSGHSVTLDGLIGVNFMVKFDGLTLEQMQAASVTFTVNGRETTVPYSESTLNASGTARKFTVYINSVEMADRITAVLSCDGKTFTQTYSLTDYLDYIDTHADQFSENVIAICDSLRDLGHYTQEYLSGIHDWEIGQDHLPIEAKTTDDIIIDSNNPELISELDFGDLYISVSECSDDIARASVSLVTETGTGIIVYVKPDVLLTDDWRVKVIGIDKDYYNIENVDEREDGRFAVIVSGIPAHELNLCFSVKIEYRTNHRVLFEAQFSVLGYVKMIIDGDNYSVKHKAAASALFKYYLAVKEYQESL